jgi:VWFA-related protein
LNLAVRLMLVALAVTLGIAPARAVSAASADPVFRVTSTLVQVDAVVTDSKGRQVTNLGIADFELTVDGKHQNLTHVSYVPVALDDPAVRGLGQAREKNPQPPGSPVPLRPEDVRRTIVLMVDDLGLSFSSMAFVRQSLLKFVDQQMQPGDLVCGLQNGSGFRCS